MTAICSVNTILSTPATSTFSRFNARTRSSTNPVRRRTSTITSPGRIGRPLDSSNSFPSTMRWMRAAIRSARRVGGESPAMRSTGGFHGTGGSVSRGSTGGHTSTSPPSPWRHASWVMGRPSSATPSAAASLANTASTAPSTAGVERNEMVRSSSCQFCPAAGTRPANRSRMAWKAAGSARWKL